MKAEDKEETEEPEALCTLWSSQLTFASCYGQGAAQVYLCVLRAAPVISQMLWAVGNLSTRTPCSAQQGSHLCLELSPESLIDAKSSTVHGARRQSRQAAQAPHGVSTSTRAAQCTETETQNTFHWHTLLIKKKKKTKTGKVSEFLWYKYS